MKNIHTNPNNVEDFWETKSIISNGKILTSSPCPYVTDLFLLVPANLLSGSQVLRFFPGEKQIVLNGLLLIYFN